MPEPLDERELHEPRDKSTRSLSASDLVDHPSTTRKFDLVAISKFLTVNADDSVSKADLVSKE